MTKKLILIIGFLGIWATTYGQRFPVQAQLQLLPPYSPHIEDWGDAIPNRVMVILTLVDGFESGYPVRLRWTISGNGIELQSTTTFTPNPIALNFGVPRMIMGAEMATYFNSDNLAFAGLARSDFNSMGGKLPEGLYTICVEVLDYNRFDGFPVSAPACFMMVADELDPPMVLSPIDLIDPLPVQNVTFQWQPMHIGAFPANYKLQVFKKVEGMSNDLVLQTQVPYYETTVMMQQMLVYGAGQPPLEIGQDYIVRVQIIDPMGGHTFKNNGYSEIKTFTYGEISLDCDWAAIALEETKVGGASFQANWEALEEAESYRLDVGLDTFFDAFADGFIDVDMGDSTHFTVTGLAAETDYWYRVRAVKTLDNGEACISENSNVVAVKVKSKCTQPPEDEDVAFECGLPTDMSLKEAPLIAELAKGDSIYAAGFKVVLTSVSGGGGTFYGGGYVANIPFLAEKVGNKVQVNVSFDGVKINENCQLVDGEIVVTGAGAAVISEDFAAKLDNIVGILATVDDVLAATETVLETIDQIIAEAEQYLSDEVMESLTNAQQALTDAKTNYDAAVASGDEAAIEAAEKEVNDAKNQLKDAMDEYKEELKEFFGEFYKIIKETFKKLKEECKDLDKLETLYTQSFVEYESNAKEFNNQILEQFNNGNYDFSGLQDIEISGVEVSEIEFQFDENYENLGDQFYENESKYSVCLAIKKLDEEIDSEDKAKEFVALIKSEGLDIFNAIGSKIKSGEESSEIVEFSAEIVKSSLKRILDKISYP